MVATWLEQHRTLSQYTCLSVNIKVALDSCACMISYFVELREYSVVYILPLPPSHVSAANGFLSV